MSKRVEVLAIIALAGCSATLAEPPAATDSHRPPWLELEGAELAVELSASPAREAPVEFLRLGVHWDADAPTAIELATSSDGTTWSPWAPAAVVGHEIEGHGAFVGVVDVGEPARYFRLRGGDGEARFAALEFLETSYSDSVEDGEEVPEGPEPEQAPTVAASVHSRASWGARPPKCTSSHAPERFTIHHTVTPTSDTISPAARLRNIQAYHQDVRGWCDIGYHYLVSRDGQRWEGRGAARLGSHVDGQNTGNIGIALLGTYAIASATETQVRGTGALVGQLAARYDIARTREMVKGHREHGPTSCPGDKLYAQLPAIIGAAAADDGGEPPPGSIRTTVRGVVYRGTDTADRISGADVTVSGRAVTASATGHFEVTDITDATITVSASAPGYAGRTISRAPSGTETWASISLSPAAGGTAALQGVVYRGTRTSARVAGASVLLSTGHQAVTDTNGYFRIEALPPGHITITATSGALRGIAARELTAGTLTWGSVSL
jgi:N-acetylmuramoyl-L-alanine amidase